MQRFFRATIADRCVLKRATEVTGEFKLPVSSSLVAVVAHTISRLPRPQPGKFVFSDSKRVLQQNRHLADVSPFAECPLCAGSGRS
jgi:hypothetical protein